MDHKNIIVFSSYPQQDMIHDKKIVGVASYTKNLLLHIKKLVHDCNLTVFCEMWGRPESYLEKGIRVERVWKRNDPLRLVLAFADMIRNPSDTVWLSYEVGMVGGYRSNMLFLFLLLILRLRKKEIVIILHQIVNNLGQLNEKTTVKTRLLNGLKNMLYNYLLTISNKVVVFEERFKQQLGNLPHILVIPHAVEQAQAMPKEIARQKLELDPSAFYMLYFGFLSPYKGIDTLIDVFPETAAKKLIVAGGKNPNLTFFSNNRAYSTYIRNTQLKAKKKEFPVSGFIEEEDIAAYFSAADAVVLPYKMFFSSSGPLSMAFAYEKPVLLSPELAGYFETQDFQTALHHAHLTTEDFLFEFTEESVTAAMERISKKYAQFVRFSQLMRQYRSWDVIAKQYVDFLVIQTSLPVVSATPLSPRRLRFGFRVRS